MAKPSLCLFGTYSDAPEYSRNAILIRSIQNLGVELVECRINSSGRQDRVRSFSSLPSLILTAIKMAVCWVRLALKFARVKKTDLIYVGYPSHADVLLVKALTLFRKTPIIMDAFICLHDTLIDDRKLFPANGVAAKLISLWERLALSAADCVLIDTQEQADLLSQRYSIPAAKMASLPVGIDESIWHEAAYPENKGEFRVIFWSTFIPLHGIETIIEAAKILQPYPNIGISIIGDGQTADRIAQLKTALEITNVQWRRELLNMQELREAASQAHCVLGVFGTSMKARRVVPYKVNQALALGRPVITAKTPAIQKYLRHEEDALLIEPGNPQQLAHAILTLVENTHLCQTLAANAAAVYKKHFSNQVIEHELSKVIARFSNTPRPSTGNAHD